MTSYPIDPPSLSEEARNREPMVFVVDDDAAVCRALERLFRSAGHRVETFTSPEAFLARRPWPMSGAVLLDVRMPGVSGPEVQRRLAARGSDLAVYFVSAEEDRPTREYVLAAGARGWFRKPLDGESLLAALGALPL
jgi:FixJ family two-component response regulator